MKTMLILRGTPGSGKSSFALLLSNIYPNSVTCSQDAFMYEGGEYKWSPEKVKMAVEQCYKQAEDNMISGTGLIIIDNTHCKDEYVERYVNLAKQHDYEVVSLVVENRHEGKNVHGVGEKTVNNMRNNLLKSLKL